MSEQSVLDELRDQLVAGVPRYERRKRRTGLAVAAIVVVAAVGVGALIGTDENTTQPVIVSPSISTPEHPVGVGVPDALVATSGNQFGVSFTDLRTGTVLEYPGGTHAMGPGAIAGAVVIPRGGLLMWRTGEPTQLFPNLVDRAGIPVGSIRGERTVVVTEDGTGAWILAAGEGERALELVDLKTRNIRLSTTVPARSRLITTLGDQAVIEPNATLPADHVMVVHPRGPRAELAVPEPANLVAIGAQGSVWIAADGERLLMLDASGRMTAEVPAPFGRWTTVGRPTIPSNSPDFRTITADGQHVLLGLTVSVTGKAVTKVLAIADFTDGTAEPEFEADEGATVDSVVSAFWASDDETIYIVDATSSGQQTVTEWRFRRDERRIEGAIPPGYFVIAAG